MPLMLSIALIILASILLVYSVRLFISSSSKIASRFGVSEYTISFLIIAIATSLPEVVVGITSAVEGTPVLSFGNAIGSNIALLTLVVALPIIVGGNISTRTIIHSKDVYYALLFAILPIALIADGILTRTDGAILLLAYTMYFFMVWRRSSLLEQIFEKIENINMWKQGALFIFSLVLLLISSEMIVQVATDISSQLNLGLIFVGLTITAIGTSLPEIAFTLGATRGRHQQEILGDIVGSVVANSTVVLGITAVISPISINNGYVGLSSALFLIVIMLLFLKFTRSKEKLDRLEAIFLFFMYFIFIAAEYYLQTGI